MTYEVREFARVAKTVRTVSIAAWILLLVPGGAAFIGHHHAGPRSSMLRTMPSHVVLAVLPGISLVLGWVVMLAAMMSPMLIAPLCHIRLRSLRRRRARATILFVTAYVGVWLLIGYLLLAITAAATVFSGGSYLPATIVLFAASGVAVLACEATVSQWMPRIQPAGCLRNRGRRGCVALWRQPRRLVHRILLGMDAVAYAMSARAFTCHGRNYDSAFLRTPRRGPIAILGLRGEHGRRHEFWSHRHEFIFVHMRHLVLPERPFGEYHLCEGGEKDTRMRQLKELIAGPEGTNRPVQALFATKLLPNYQNSKPSGSRAEPWGDQPSKCHDTSPKSVLPFGQKFPKLIRGFSHRIASACISAVTLCFRESCGYDHGCTHLQSFAWTALRVVTKSVTE